jgi:poly(hydroxyalkanoate) granule-associated protein
MAKGKVAKRQDDSDIARKIWLAGVGAYGRAFNEAQERLDKLADNAGEMFDELVARGEKIEDKVRSQISKSDAGGRVTEFVDQARKFGASQRADIEDRVAAVRKTVGDAISAPAHLLGIGRTIDKLTKRIEVLENQLTATKKGKGRSSRKGA